MEYKERQQVVFVARKLWAGGAEKVLYYLANRLDRNKFEPIVIYMIWQENIPVSYDPSIPLYCLEKNGLNQNLPKSREYISEDKKKPELIPSEEKSPGITNNHNYSFQQSIFKLLYRIYMRMPENIRSRLHLRQHIVKFAQFGITNEIGNNTHPRSGELNQNDTNVRFTADLIATEVGINIPDVLHINRILKSIHSDAILIPMQEEPTVRVWINQMFSPRNYISYLCAPESLHMPLIYPDENRFMVENWLFANAEKSASAVVVPNNWMTSDMINNFGVDPERIRVIPNPVDCELILDKKSQYFDVEYLESTNKTVFVQLARVDSQKNHVLLLEACRVLKRKYTNFLVIVIGNGNEFQKIKDLINKFKLSKHVLMIGESGNPYPYLARARASLLTSKWEASPLVLVDSMLCGAVPIAVDCVAGPRDILGENEFGILVPPEDPEAFADAMYRIATDDRLYTQLREKGMREAWRYDIKEVVNQWENLIVEVANNRFDNGLVLPH